MSEAPGFWRPTLGRCLQAWVIVALFFWLGITRILEVMGKGMAFGWLAVFVLAPLTLAGWAVARAGRKAGTWATVGAVVATWAVLIALGFPLSHASVYLNFWAHRAAYDAVVTDMTAGRLDGRSEGRRHGVQYSRPLMGPSSVGFVWYWDFDIGQGVFYDETQCPPRPPAPEPPPSAAPPEPQANGADPPTIKNAGRLGSEQFRLGGHYCYFSVP